MEFLLSAVLGELSTRLINFFIKKISKPTELDVVGNLQRDLLRAQIIADEAMGRPITNHAMLIQLDLLREAIYRGCYKLDSFRYQSQNKDTQKQVWSHFVSLSKVISAMKLLFSIRDTQDLVELQEVLDNLRSMILDTNELVLFLTSYPCLYRQPYSMHLLLGNCLFGRQMEVELVINFLLNTQTHGSEGIVEVLPIVGPSKVGKSTLVAHICKDERVRDHISEVIFLRDHDFTDDELATFRERYSRIKQNQVTKSNKGRRLLIVVELAGNLNQDAWNMLYSTCVSSHSKIIVTSQSDNIVKFGTTQALTLKHLSHEAYWYFLKTLTFGSKNPEMHPRFANLAMEITRLLDGTLFRANIAAKLLRDNFNVRFWCKVLAFLRMLDQKHVARFGEHPFHVVDQYRPARFWRTGAPSKDFVIYHRYHQRSSEEEVPNIGIQDVHYGSVKPHGKFEFLVWRSRIPPYHSYVYTCEIVELKTIGVKRKRTMKNRVTLC